MKVTSATLVTLVALLGTIGQALQVNSDAKVAAVGAALASVYTVCHLFLNKPAVSAAVVPAPASSSSVSAS